jgi:hypothetical protein
MDFRTDKHEASRLFLIYSALTFIIDGRSGERLIWRSKRHTMRILTIDGANVKGRTFRYNLSPATVIFGPNYSGKTTLLTAIRLALAGYLPPPIGRQPQAIYNALAGNPEASGELVVGATCADNDGRNPTRYETRWVRSGKKTSVSGGIGPERALPPILIDPRTFFSASGPARMQAVFEACNVVITQETIIGAMSKATAKVFPVISRTAVENTVVAKLRSAWAINSLQPHVAMRELIAAAKEILKDLKAELKAAEALVNVIVWEGEVPEDVEADMLRMEGEKKKVEGALMAAELRRNRSIQQEETNKNLQGSIARLRADIAMNTWDEEPTKPEYIRGVLDAMQRELTKLQGRNSERRAKRDQIRNRLRLLGAGTCPTCGCEGEGLNVLRGTLEAELADVPTDEDEGALAAKVEDAMRLYQKAALDHRRYLDALTQNAANEREIARMQGVVKEPEKWNEADIEVGRKDLARVDSALGLLSAAGIRREAYNQTLARRRRVDDDLETVAAKVATAEAIVVALTELMVDTIERSFKRVMADTGTITDGILNSSLEYEEELGRRVSAKDRDHGCLAPVGAWISHEAFSGTEEAVAYAAFSVAMAMRSSFRLVIMDELGRMDVTVRAQVLRRMVELVEKGVIDQFIGIDTVEPAVTGGLGLLEFRSPGF